MEVSDVSPNNGASSQPLETQISITFDEEIDKDSLIDSGSFVVRASTSKLVIEGPGMENFSLPPYNYLSSDVYSGIVPGLITTEDNLTFLFAPTTILQPNATIEVLLGTKIRTKTIGAPTSGVDNEGNGVITLKGPYIGSDDTFTITIISSGSLGTATFKYQKDSEGMDSELIVTDRLVELEDGVFVVFKAGTYEEDDTFTFEVFESEVLESIYSFSFTTGSPTYTEVSDDRPSVQLVERTIEGVRKVNEITSDEESPLSLVSSSPVFGTSNVPLGSSTITLTFNKDIDPDSLAASVVKVYMESLPMSEEEETSFPMLISKTVDGNKLILRFRG